MKTPIVVCHGGGANSTAMLIGMHRRGVVPDLVMFADTGGERPETYAFIKTFSAWLVNRGFPAITVVKSIGVTLEEDCLARTTLPSVAFGFKTCSQRWKVAPQDKFLNSWEPARASWAANGKVLKLIGYDAGEQGRAKDYSSKKYITAYPLIEWGWGRAECIEVVKSEGFSPRKSSCFFCPNAKRWEVTQLAKDHPDLAERAFAMERNADGLDTVKGLGRSYSWEALVNADAAQMKMFDEFTDPMPCGCYDGEDACEIPAESK